MTVLRATARVHGAITVVNAIPTGRGAAAGIDLPMEATVELQDGSGEIAVTIQDDPAEDAGLVRAALRHAAAAAGRAVHGRVTTRSPIPIARGLKSSSCCANAVVLATLRALGAPADAPTVLRLGVAAAREARVTATGGLDDAAASLQGGVVVTDNRHDTVLRRDPVPEGAAVLLLVPARKRYTRDAVSALGAAQTACQTAHRLAMEGRWLDALTLNGFACATALGEPLDAQVAALGAGADAAGMSGTGPALAAVCPNGTLEHVREALTGFEGTLMEARLTNAGWEAPP